jgi:hypothetical protein
MMRERIKPIGRKPGQLFAIDIAELSYLKWMGDVSFIDDLSHYLLNGVVIVRPDLFGMAKVIDLAPEGQAPEPAWFVRMAVGDLRELVAALPLYLPKICFCRRNDGRLRRYSLERFAKAVGKFERRT